ncbi:Alpha-aminoadipate--LysW ligase LysX [Limihaloglobus sulfuriphilus]|uniref:Alpha-aminoadipate--LysW ligase LysX n=1 Tax=Limihaloglobus sulfuriphilus TaxID=1851148 RepID=A0A1Q2MH81_9BACT|nr:ATP-grasp domain-containing protein [Limihaloglobus sulfuriphilus]AQQ72065.1 Alpha-aminoadipate--LysW ligase LysX [Limihaloglobus sulfuriphilus]
MFTCVGRRVGLINLFRESALRLGIELGVYGCDAEKLSPALYACDEHQVVNSVLDETYIETLLDMIKKWDIGLIIPTIDTELPVLAEHKQRILDCGCEVLVSEPRVIKACYDKLNTYKYLSAHNVGTPMTCLPGEALASKDFEYPCILKPAHGSASRGIHKAYSRKDIEFFSNRHRDVIVQEYVQGKEFTCDVFVDRGGEVRCCVPRQRIETRGGEVSKSQIVKRQDLIDEAVKAVKSLGCSFGMITVQELLADNGDIMIFDINPRFGGGVPLAIHAGADFPGWIMQSLGGELDHDKINFYDYQDGLIMLRYDSEIWL